MENLELSTAEHVGKDVVISCSECGVSTEREEQPVPSHLMQKRTHTAFCNKIYICG
jgi:hypothetical protein